MGLLAVLDAAGSLQQLNGRVGPSEVHGSLVRWYSLFRDHGPRSIDSPLQALGQPDFDDRLAGHPQPRGLPIQLLNHPDGEIDVDAGQWAQVA